MFDLLPFPIAVGTIVVLGGYALFQILCYTARPRPIPGIPYILESAQNALGDFPAAMAYHKEKGAIMDYPQSVCAQLNVPVAQFFFQPWGKPLVIVCDQREAQDIMTQRTREFDRSPLFSDLFRALLPNSTITMPTDEHWKFGRNLMRDTMSPRFLNSVIAQRSFDAAVDLVELLKNKTRLARGRSFDVKEDLNMTLTDIIWRATFNSDLESCKSQIRYLSEIDSIDLPANEFTPADIPACEPPFAYRALDQLFASSQIAMESPFGYYTHWIAMKFRSSLRNALNTMHKMVDERIQEATRRSDQSSSEEELKAVVDLVVRRHRQAVSKEKSPYSHELAAKKLRDELLLFLFAGATTTAETMQWGLKLLTAHQDIQKKLRSSIQAAYPRNTSPPATGEAIVKTHVPYLEAFIYETLRFRPIVQNNLRVALVDTEVLGHRIPKGTQLLLQVNRAEIGQKLYDIEETKRSHTSQASGKANSERWRTPEFETFKPERWLVDGEFDSQMASMLTFGAGPRGCFGQKAAMLEMRLLYTLILWNFELLPLDQSAVNFKFVEKLTLRAEDVLVRLRELPTDL